MSGPTLAVLCLAPHVEDRVLPLLTGTDVLVGARAAGATEAVAAVGRLRPELLVVSADARFLDAVLLAAAVGAGTALVVLAEGEAGREHAAALGLRHPVPADAPDGDLLAALAGAEAHPVDAPPAQKPPVRPSPGRVTAVWGPAGAPGRTATAIALATELAAAGTRTALVDVDTVGAAVAPSLGLFDEAPGIAAACRLAAAGALSASELDRIAQQHRGARGGFDVLTGIGRPARWPELSSERVTKVLERCRGWAVHTVVDTGFNLEADEEIVSDLMAPRRNAATLAALQAADTVVAIGAGDPVGLARFVRAYADLLDVVEPHRIRVVIGKVRQSAVGLGAGSQIRASLQRFGGIEDVTLVPWDPVAYDTALLTGRSLPEAAPRSAATAALHRFALDHLLERAEPERRRRFRPARRLQPA